VTRQFELKLADGRRVVWSGMNGVDASQSYANACPGVTVTAWRRHKMTGFVAPFAPGHGVIIEPGDWRWGRPYDPPGLGV